MGFDLEPGVRGEGPGDKSLVTGAGPVHTAVRASRATLLQLRACVIFTAQVIAIQLRGQPAVCEGEVRELVLMLSRSILHAAGRLSIMKHPPLDEARMAPRPKLRKRPHQIHSNYCI
ncbi:unnamed protein product [Danaus chrysippus]|uniref:(African queen) hypothetical protein n=1 Tax=Danaus chrysippus TaxID=151541 RepID=A0A8J2QPX5_9NEOP|nr:unnamed protein product [Danaus chrysippus]